MLRATLLVALALTFLSDRAEALVMCAPKRSSGEIREGAPIKLRTACKPNESQVDPISLGLQGPAGPQGEPGPTGASGPAGPGMVARDSEGRTIGPVGYSNVAEPDYPESVTVATTSVNGVQRTVWVRVDPVGFRTGPSLIGLAGAVFFTSNNCTGTPLVEASSQQQEMAYRGVVIGPSSQVFPWASASLHGPGTTLYFPAGDRFTAATKSRAEPMQFGGSCPGGFAIDAFTCCEVVADGVDVAPATTIDLGSFEPPFVFEPQ